jgi:hypothetical protein
MTSHLRLFLEGTEQAAALGAAAVLFVLLAALGRAVTGPRALPEAAPIYGWSAAAALILALHILFGLGFSLAGWAAIVAGGIAAAGLVHRLDRRGPRRLRDAVEILLARRVVRERHEGGIALLRHVDVAGGARAAHVEGGGRPRRPQHAEMDEKLLHGIEIGRAQPPVCQVHHLDQWHGRLPRP